MTRDILAGLAQLAGLAFVLWLADLVWCRLLDDAMREPRVDRARHTLESPPTRLRIAEEQHARGTLCQSCGCPTRRIVVVRLWDDTARVCRECAHDLAPECAA